MLPADRAKMCGYLAGLLKSEALVEALGYIEQDHGYTVDEQCELVLTEAPTFCEGKRAELIYGNPGSSQHHSNRRSLKPARRRRTNPGTSKRSDPRSGRWEAGPAACRMVRAA